MAQASPSQAETATTAQASSARTIARVPLDEGSHCRDSRQENGRTGRFSEPLTRPLSFHVVHVGISMNQISIRAETPSDHNAIRDLIVEVFHETYGSGEAEATLVE